MNISIAESVVSEEPEFLAGYAIIKDVSVYKSSKSLKKEIAKVIKSVRNKYPSRVEMYNSKRVEELRELFRRRGIDPTRYTPSAEALLKRVVDGNDLYRINNVVDCNNVGSMRYELPMGVYDLGKLVGDIVFDIGDDSDIMETMAKGSMNMKDILLTRDSEKLFGSPVSDSPHAKITEDTSSVLLLVYGTKNIGRDYTSKALQHTAEKISEYTGGDIKELEVILCKSNK